MSSTVLERPRVQVGTSTKPVEEMTCDELAEELDRLRAVDDISNYLRISQLETEQEKKGCI